MHCWCTAAQWHAAADPLAPLGPCQSCRPHTFNAQWQWGAAAIKLVRDGCRDALHDVPYQAVGPASSRAGIGLQVGAGAQDLAIVLLRQDQCIVMGGMMLGAPRGASYVMRCHVPGTRWGTLCPKSYARTSLVSPALTTVLLIMLSDTVSLESAGCVVSSVQDALFVMEPLTR